MVSLRKNCEIKDISFVMFYSQICHVLYKAVHISLFLLVLSLSYSFFSSPGSVEVVLLHFPISALAWFTNVFIDVSSGPWQHTRVPLVFVLDAPSPDAVTCKAGLDLFTSCHGTINVLCIRSDVCALSVVLQQGCCIVLQCYIRALTGAAKFLILE